MKECICLKKHQGLVCMSCECTVCHTSTSSKVEELWKEYDEKFHFSDCSDTGSNETFDWFMGKLKAKEEELVGRIEELRKKNKEVPPYNEIEKIDERAYEAACRDILALIKGEANK